MHQLLEAGSWVGPGIRLDTLDKQDIPCSHQELKYGPLDAQPVAVSLH